MTNNTKSVIIFIESEAIAMKKMYQTKQPVNKKIIITANDSKVRNELHFMACQNHNVAYVAKDKSKVIPRKQKYKKIDF